MISSSAGAFSAPRDVSGASGLVADSVAAGVDESIGGADVGGAVVDGAVVGAIGGTVAGGVATWIIDVDAMRA